MMTDPPIKWRYYKKEQLGGGVYVEADPRVEGGYKGILLSATDTHGIINRIYLDPEAFLHLLLYWDRLGSDRINTTEEHRK
jgi:hypothetical protein